MATDVSLGGKQAGAFKTFPEFTKLTLADKAKYEPFIRDFPPYDDISFATLMMWWNSLDSCSIAQLNGNLIISYWMPGMEQFSGLSVVGTNKIDETICTIFDHQQAKGEKPRLAQVPEFTIEHLVHPELFEFKTMRNFDEYVVKLSKFLPINHALSYRRHRIKKFLSCIGDKQAIVRPVDLSLEDNKRLLLEAATTWPTKGTINDIVKMSNEALLVAIEHAEEIGTENLCLFVDNEIQAFILYHLPNDRQYASFSHAKVGTDIPYTYDYMVYAFSKWFVDHEIIYVNITSDLGLPMLRALKLALGPCNYFRKYIVEPARPESEL